MTEPPTNKVVVRCQWCDVDAQPGATHCAGCGAALPLVDSLGEMVVPGVTDVDPDLAIYRNKPLRIPRGSAGQYAATHALGAAAADPTGLLALGALAAVAVSEYRAAGQGRPGKEIDPDKVGQPSEPALKMAQQLQRAQADRNATPDD